MEPSETDINIKALKKRLKKEKTPAHYYEYAMALANDPKADWLMERLLWKGHALEPTYSPILLALANLVPDRKRDHKLLPDLLAAYEEHPQRAALLSEAIRLAGGDKKAALTRRLLTEHLDRIEGYRQLELLEPKDADTLLQEIPWLAQGQAIRHRVFTYLDEREDPHSALAFYRNIDHKVPYERDILEWLLRCSADSHSAERTQWEEAYRTIILSQVEGHLADSEVYAARNCLAQANEHFDDGYVKLLGFFLNEITDREINEDELSSLTKSFHGNAYLHERFGDWLNGQKKWREAKWHYERILNKEDRPDIRKKLAAQSQGLSDPILILSEVSFPISGLTHLGLNLDVITPIMKHYDIICDNPALEILALLEPNHQDGQGQMRVYRSQRFVGSPVKVNFPVEVVLPIKF